MSIKTFRAGDGITIIALKNAQYIGQAEYITYTIHEHAAMGTISFLECIADPRGCDIQLSYKDGETKICEWFLDVDLSNNLYLQTPITFVTAQYQKNVYDVEEVKK